jgi:hypothetical protein
MFLAPSSPAFRLLNFISPLPHPCCIRASIRVNEDRKDMERGSQEMKMCLYHYGTFHKPLAF